MKCSKDAFWKCLKRYISKTIIVLTILFILLQHGYRVQLYKYKSGRNPLLLLLIEVLLLPLPPLMPPLLEVLLRRRKLV